MNHLLPIGWTAAGRTGTPLRVAPAGERGTGVPLANYARRAGPPYPALFLAVTALCMGKGIVIMAKFLARRRPRPEANALDSLEIPVACHGGGKNHLDDQLTEPGFPDIDYYVMGPPVRVERGSGRGPDTPAALRRPPRCPPLPSSPLRIRQPQLPGTSAGGERCPFPGRLWNACSFPSRPVPVPHCPYPGTTPYLQSSSPDPWGGRPHSGTARSSRGRRQRQTTR